MNHLASTLSTADHGAAVVPTSHDDRLGHQVRNALNASGYATISALQCQVHEGVVTLNGVVGSFYMKQLAQEAVRRIGAERIENRVKVIYR